MAIVSVYGPGAHVEMLTTRIMAIIANTANQHAKDEFWRGYKQGHLLANPIEVEL